MAILTLILAAAVTLSPELESWKKEIEARGGAPVVVAKADYNRERNELSLADGTPRRELFATYLKQEEFARQFALMNAVMIHQRGADEEAYLVLLNGAREKDWAGHETALLAHEFGHAWIKAQGYPTPAFVNNRWACVGIHTGDITQHVLIRRELEARKIDYKTFWRKSLGEATARMETGKAPPEEDRCARVQQVAQLVDVRLGWKAGEWEGQRGYEAAALKAMPEAGETTEQIVEYLRRHDMANRDEHREALKYVFTRLRDLAYQRTKDYRVENKQVSPDSLAQ